MVITTIKEKQVFAHTCRRGKSQAEKAFILHTSKIDQKKCSEQFQIGYIVTKKIGSAVTRNRIKRRLRAAIAEVLPVYGSKDTYYIFRGRKFCTEISFIDLKKSIMYALEKTQRTQTTTSC